MLSHDKPPSIRLQHSAATSTPPTIATTLSTNDAPWTFGRRPGKSLQLNPDDLGVSRDAGRIEHSDGRWTVTNDSEVRTLHVDRIGQPRVLVAPGAGHVLVAGESTIVVVGRFFSYLVDVCATPRHTDGVDSSGIKTSVANPTRGELQAVAAVAWGYFQPHPRYRPEPLTYNEAAKAIGDPNLSTAIRKRFERFRKSWLQGDGTIDPDAPDMRKQLVEACLVNQLLPPDLFNDLVAEFASPAPDA